MQKLLTFLRQNGLSVFSLLAIIGIIAWVGWRPSRPVLPEPTPAPTLAATPSNQTFNTSLLEKAIAAAKSLNLDTGVFESCLVSGKYRQLVQDSSTEAQTLGLGSTPSSIINGSLVIGALPQAEFDKALTSSEKGSLVPDVSGLPYLGKADAPILFVGYGDYQCSFCRRFHDETLPYLKEKYFDTGKAKFVYKDFTIFGADSQLIAQAARCAGDQGKFWQYHAKAFTLNSAD
jgi:protein-disulfide isomerase